MSADLIASLGLGFDIVGAVWVVKSVIAARDDELARAADQAAVYVADPHVSPPPPYRSGLASPGRSTRGRRS